MKSLDYGHILRFRGVLKVISRIKGAPVDLETLPRSLRRKIFQPKNLSSYPLISGDTFAALCDYELQERDLASGTSSLALLKSFKRIFVGAKPLNDRAFRMAKLLQEHPLPLLKDSDLIIHNGDEIPSREEIATLAHHFRSLYSVNYLGDLENVYPIPIGLENKRIFRNGVPRDYLQHNRLKPKAKREIDFLFAFSIHTNTEERSQALSFAPKLKNSYVVSGPITPKNYRELIKNSKFVVSPPGNGPDCHRTWESLYLGATPIVKARFWPFAKMSLPVLKVSDWHDLMEISPTIEMFGDSSWTSINNWLEKPLRLT